MYSLIKQLFTIYLCKTMLKSLIITFVFFLSGVNAYSMASNKVLAISSYGADYQWSNAIVDEIALELNKAYPGIELNIEYLSSELFVKAENWELKINTILESYQDATPLAIIFISDEAWLAFNSVNTEKFKDVPLLLCAVKPHTIDLNIFQQDISKLQLSQFSSTQLVMKKYNATGVLREMNIHGYISLITNMVPKVDRFTLITDNRFYGVYTRLVFEDEIKNKHAKLPVEYLDARFINTDSLLNRLQDITPTTGVLLTSWLTGEHGFQYSKDYIYKNMSSILQTPIFITNNIGIEKGYFIGGLFNNSSFWGAKVATMLLDVIKGKSPKEIPSIIEKDEQCNIDWETLQKFDLLTNGLPDDVTYINEPQSMFEKYKIQISVIAIIFFIILGAYIYILRSHIRLQKTQKLALQAVKETTDANKKLQEARQELILALKKAEESDSLKTSFIANMSHEIRTPLNAIVGFSELLLTIDNDDELKAQSVAIIKRNSDLLLYLISSILDISKIESGTMSFSYADVDISMICNDIVIALQPKCKQGVTLIFNPPNETIIAHTDINRLVQVLTNLMTNAIKFTDSGTIILSYISIDDQYVEFRVKDSGIGIPADKQEQIFDRFFKLNCNIEGTGLGLSICKTIVEALDGKIHVESELNKGSLFSFKIKKSMK